MNDDASLLRRYAEEGSQAAFTELVRRHVDLVYGAALRRTGGDEHRAADVAQQVFIQLARQARKLSGHPVLGAWLHTATRNAALNLMISEQRRQSREAEALAQNRAGAGGEPDWEHLRPLLDGAIDELPEADRAAVVLRFLERRAFAEIGAALRVSEDAARMRTERALEKLRTALARRGVRSTVAALGALVASQPLVSAPLGLAGTLAAQSLAVTGSGTLVAFLASFMTAKIITTAALSALVAFGAGSYLGHSRPAEVPPPVVAENPQHVQMIETLRSDNDRLKTEVVALHADVARLNETATQVAAQRAATPPVRGAKSYALGMSQGEIQRTILNNLRQVAAARDQYRLEHGRSPNSIEDLVGAKLYIRTLRTVGGEEYTSLSMADKALLTVVTPDGIAVTYDPAGTMTTRPETSPAEQKLQELSRLSAGAVNKALAAYRAANNGGNPTNEQALLPYFATKEEGADFLELVEAQKAAGR